jgi:hypothetical protein
MPIFTCDTKCIIMLPCASILPTRKKKENNSLHDSASLSAYENEFNHYSLSSSSSSSSYKAVEVQENWETKLGNKNMMMVDENHKMDHIWLACNLLTYTLYTV